MHAHKSTRSLSHSFIHSHSIFGFWFFKWKNRIHHRHIDSIDTHYIREILVQSEFYHQHHLTHSLTHSRFFHSFNVVHFIYQFCCCFDICMFVEMLTTQTTEKRKFQFFIHFYCCTRHHRGFYHSVLSVFPLFFLLFRRRFKFVFCCWVFICCLCILLSIFFSVSFSLFFLDSKTFECNDVELINDFLQNNTNTHSHIFTASAISSVQLQISTKKKLK